VSVKSVFPVLHEKNTPKNTHLVKPRYHQTIQIDIHIRIILAKCHELAYGTVKLLIAILIRRPTGPRLGHRSHAVFSFMYRYFKLNIVDILRFIVLEFLILILIAMELPLHSENGIAVILKENHTVPRTSRTFFNQKMQANRSKTCY